MKNVDSNIEPTFDLETQTLAEIGGPVTGIDEAGRGPWAGPVVAAAVILNPKTIPNGLADSKKLSEEKRERLFDQISEHAAVGVGIADVQRIDRDNILAATMWAMSEAVKQLSEAPRFALVDGNRAPQLPCQTKTIIKGDAKCLSIAAASIIAKVTRDRIMIALGQQLPAYGFERHKGYGTKWHQQAIFEHGVCEHHRRSFKPIREALKNELS